MAANKFATMIHKNTNKITLILVYALLEWILIILLLINSLFSYLIIKFADYFGLKRPCLWCSRVDHFFEPAKFDQNSYRSLVCDNHALEISKLGYCSNHRKLVESQDMCEDCFSSCSNNNTNCNQDGFLNKKFAFFPWMKQLGVVHDNCENFEIKLCSCCGVGLDTSISSRLFCSDDYVVKPSSLSDLEITQKGNFVWESCFDDIIDERDDFDKKRPGFVCDRCGEEQRIVQNRDVDDFKTEKVTEDFSSFVSSFDCKETVSDDKDETKDDACVEKEQELTLKDDLDVVVDDRSCDQLETKEVDCSKEKSEEVQPQQHLEFYIDQQDCYLIPIELESSRSVEKKNSERNMEGEIDNGDFVMEFDSKRVGTQYELVLEEKSHFEEKVPLLPIQECDEENFVDEVESKDLNENENENLPEMYADYELVKDDLEPADIAQPIQTCTSNNDSVQEWSEEVAVEMESDNNQVSDEALEMHIDEIEADVSIGTEIPDHEPIEDIQTEEVPNLCLCDGEEPSTSNADYPAYCEHGCKHAEEDVIEFRTLTVETSEPVINIHLSLCSESNDVEKDKIPDTPTSMDSPHHLHKKLLLLERLESSAEESLDGSALSDSEAGDGVLTVEKLKAALRSERKTLNALYGELEEERSASAVAANQTMAMINRLQEEKAAMQMEALQYQRMMEEQSEYDQEALQLLNELMIKREKEKAELEKELDVYRKKVQDYEMKEKLMLLKRRKESSLRSGTSSASFSNAEDSDGQSVDLNHEAKEEESCENHQGSSNQNTPVDAVVYLEDSLNNFEVERLSILEQLKVLEEKLFTLSDEEEQLFEDIKSIEHFHEENGNGYSEDFEYGNGTNGITNGHYKEMNGKHHHERKIIGAKAKRLLPLFDAIDAEGEDGMLNGHEEGVDSITFDMDLKKLAMEEEVDHVYERLQALEADREFLKHCMTSLKKGDKGVELLQEILQHLRDLRNVELRARNVEDGAV